MKQLSTSLQNKWKIRSCQLLGLCLLTLSQAVHGSSANGSQRSHELVSKTLAGLGAGRDIGTVATITVEGREITQDLVENDHPLTPPFLTRSANTIHRSYDLEGQIQRTSVMDGSSSLTSLLSRDLSLVLDPKVSEAPGKIGAASPEWTMRDPISALRLAARSNDLALQPDVVWHGGLQHVVSFHDGRYPVSIFIDVATGLPNAIETVVTYDDQHMSEAIAWNALGDIIERTEYQNWSFVDGIRYPFQQDRLRNGQLIWTLAITSARLNDPVDAHELTLVSDPPFRRASVQDLRPTQQVPNGPYPNKPIAEIAPGVVQIPNSWYSAIVRQEDGLVIIDAPISAGYSSGVLEEAAKRFPGLRVKALITSTGFFWHVAGVREYAARGIPIYAEARNVPVINQIIAAPHNLAPDNLSRQRKARIQVIPVTKRTTIGRGANAIQIYPITRATQPMLMSYIQSARLLHTGEMVQPLGPGGAILFPESLIELTQTVAENHLSIEDIIGMHMSPTPWTAVSDVLRSAGGKVTSEP